MIDSRDEPRNETGLKSPRGLSVGVASVGKSSGPISAAYADHRTLTSLIRDSMKAAGLGQRDPARPLADVIQPGMSVLLKPNWVLHHNQGGHGMECMVTHPSFILAALAEVVAAQPGLIMIGDAPIQGCRWDQLVTKDFVDRTRSIAGDIPIQFIDFRRTILRENNGFQSIDTEARPADRFALFDLGSDSLLEPISKPEGRFRVTMYNPDLLAATHHAGTHRYLLCKEVFEADVVINLPKLKTHRKAGLTAALKNLVGLNGNKDYLPHHRIGGSSFGGDCYPGAAPLKRMAESCLDQANRHIATDRGQVWTSRAYRLLGLHQRIAGDAEIEGGWYGNATVWRMALDLNRIVLYGNADGQMTDEPRRRIWSLTDAIICGQGEGPLSPEPIEVGVVTFSEWPAAADEVHAALLGLDANLIPLVHESQAEFRWPLVPRGGIAEVQYEGKRITFDELSSRLGVKAKPPAGWAGHCELHREVA